MCYPYINLEQGVIKGGGGANVGTLAFDPVTLKYYLMVN